MRCRRVLCRADVVDRASLRVWCRRVWCMRVWCMRVWCMRVWCGVVQGRCGAGECGVGRMCALPFSKFKGAVPYMECLRPLARSLYLVLALISRPKFRPASDRACVCGTEFSAVRYFYYVRAIGTPAGCAGAVGGEVNISGTGLSTYTRRTSTGPWGPSHRANSGPLVV